MLRFFPSHPRLRRLTIAALVLAVLFGGAATAGYVYYRNRTGDIYHPHALFVPEAPTQLPAPKKGVDRFAWPVYGYTPDHQRNFPAPPSMSPPFTQLWQRDAHAILEFPPVMYGPRLFQLADDGTLRAIDKYTGQLMWQRRMGQLAASSPAVNASTVFITIMQRAGSSAGRAAALDSTNGHIRWMRNLPSASESSPLLDGGRIYFGSQDGTVYALDTRTGNNVWTYHAAGAVKASPTLKNGKLFFGDYSGQLQAISASDGRRIWRSGSGGAVFGSGEFYSTPAVVYGRVFLGNTDGRVYAYDMGSGRLDWAKQTGAYVYSSPAVTNAPNVGPTIYIGSYDGNFYALDAQSGSVRWTYRAGGRISGSPTILGRIVYFADLGDKRTIGLDVSTHQKQFEEHTGSFDPVISDGTRLYLTGYTTIAALRPTATLRKTTPAKPATPAKTTPQAPASPATGATSAVPTQTATTGYPLVAFNTCAMRFLVTLTNRGSGACGTSGDAAATG